jgi:hypothetical protein
MQLTRRHDVGGSIGFSWLFASWFGRPNVNALHE